MPSNALRSQAVASDTDLLTVGRAAGNAKKLGPREEAMSRFTAFVTVATVGVLATALSAQAAQYGTAEEAKAMLIKAVAAVKEDKAKALDMFSKGDGGFKDRDLYVACSNASDGIVTAHPTMKGKQLREILGKKGYPLGQEMMQKASEGTIGEVTYWWPRPGSDKPLEKISYYTKVGDQICSVGYYKE
jgi:Cache domain